LKKTLLALIVVFACFFAISVCEAREPKTPDCDYSEAVKTARETMWKAVTNGQGISVTVAIADKGKIVYAEGIGAADHAENRPVDVNTRFNIGSTSKMYAAAGILLLVDDGKVALDDSVTKYITEFRMKDPRYKDITVRMLFNHSSGLPGTYSYVGYKTDDKIQKLLIDSMAEAYLKHAPGAMSIYCNDGFTLAEMIIERVSGEKFVDFLAKRVFKPLGMKNTGGSVGEVNVKNTAEYYDSQSGKKYPREVLMVYGAGGLSSTASDQCRFVSSFSPYGKHILSDASIKEILRTQPTLFSDKLRGPQICSEFGWDYSSLPDYEAKGIQVLAKSGGTAAYNSYVQTIPKYGVTVAFSIAGHATSMEAMSRAILDAVMRCKKIDIPEPKPVEKPVEPQLIPEELSGYEGFYVNASNVVKVRFDRKNKKLDLIPLAEKRKGDAKEAVKDDAPVMSFVYNNGYFFCSEKNIQVYFTTVGGESYIALHKIQRYGTDSLFYQKISELREPKTLKLDLSDKKWLVRNAVPYIVAGLSNMSASKTYPELPGYVYFDGLRKVESPECASIAATAFRDQAALSLVELNGETWARSNIFLYSPADKARKLIDGVNRVVIKPEGFNEWLKVEKGAVVKFEKPSTDARIIIINEDEPIYDSVADNEEFYAPAGSLIQFAGAPGNMFKIYAK
jgi:CubicO group peptidase (beta-lactamase class C family)